MPNTSNGCPSPTTHQSEDFWWAWNLSNIQLSHILDWESNDLCHGSRLIQDRRNIGLSNWKNMSQDCSRGKAVFQSIKINEILRMGDLFVSCQSPVNKFFLPIFQNPGPFVKFGFRCPLPHCSIRDESISHSEISSMFLPTSPGYFSYYYIIGTDMCIFCSVLRAPRFIFFTDNIGDFFQNFTHQNLASSLT